MAEKSQTKAAAAMADDKKRAIETAMQQIERTYGKGSIMRFGDNTVSNVEAISTGSLALDLALGIGGLFIPYTKQPCLDHQVIPCCHIGINARRLDQTAYSRSYLRKLLPGTSKNRILPCRRVCQSTDHL